MAAMKVRNFIMQTMRNFLIAIALTDSVWSRNFDGVFQSNFITIPYLVGNLSF